MTTRKSASVAQRSVGGTSSVAAKNGGVAAVTQNDYDYSSIAVTYGVPVGLLTIFGLGAVYLSKRLGDLETNVDAMKRNQVRHLTENDTRLIVLQMAKDGLIHLSSPHEQQLQQQQQILIQRQQELEALLSQKQAEYQAYTQHVQSELTSTTTPTSTSEESGNESEEVVAATDWVPKRASNNE